MTDGWETAPGRQPKVKPKAYVMCVDKRSGALYLKREYPPFVGELPYVAVLTAAVIFAVVSCCRYIQIRTSVECRIRRTETLERNFRSLESDNTLREKEAMRMPDLDEIYQIATKELGMVQAESSNVVFYQRTNSEFVYQIDNIPNVGFH